MKVSENHVEVIMIAYIPKEWHVEGKPDIYKWVTSDPYERFKFAAVCRKENIPYTINTNKNNVGKKEYKQTYKKQEKKRNIFEVLEKWLSA